MLFMQSNLVGFILVDTANLILLFHLFTSVVTIDSWAQNLSHFEIAVGIQICGVAVAFSNGINIRNQLYSCASSTLTFSLIRNEYYGSQINSKFTFYSIHTFNGWIVMANAIAITP